MNNILFKNSKFNLIYSDNLYIIIDDKKYELLYDEKKLCIHIKTENNDVNIKLFNAFNLKNLIFDFQKEQNSYTGNVFGLISVLEFCEIINTFIIRDKDIKRQHPERLVNNSSSIFNKDLVKYYKGYYIYVESDRESWDTTVYTAERFDKGDGIYHKIQGDFIYCSTLESIMSEIDNKHKYLGCKVKFHNIDCIVANVYNNKTNHYRLIAIGGTTEQLQNDKSFTEYYEWGAIAAHIICPCCKQTIWVDDTKIPHNENYEILCDNCKTLIKMKKLS